MDSSWGVERLVRGGQSIAAIAHVLGVIGQTPHIWVKAEAHGRLVVAGGKLVSTEHMEIVLLRADAGAGEDGLTLLN